MSMKLKKLYPWKQYLFSEPTFKDLLGLGTRPVPEVMFTIYCPTTTVLRPFVRDYQGEPLPEKNTHPPTILIIMQSLSASSIYHDP